jgi:hypothetical protein
MGLVAVGFFQSQGMFQSVIRVYTLDSHYRIYIYIEFCDVVEAGIIHKKIYPKYIY